MQFTNFSQLRKAIRSIGVEIFEGTLLKRLKLGKLEGNTTDSENLVLGKFGIYHLEKGRLARVILHITDKEKRWIEQNPEALEHLNNEQYNAQPLVEKLHRYHFTQCEKLEEMFNNGINTRYYLAQRMDGTFNYSIIENNNILHENKNQKLKVCQYCLSVLMRLTGEYYNIGNFMPNNIFDAVPQPNGADLDLECNAVPNVYTEDWQKISSKAKELASWRCETCDLDLSNAKQYLHCHHMDSNRANNLIGNLRVLCVSCHASEPNHQHIKESDDYKKFVSEYRNY